MVIGILILPVFKRATTGVQLLGWLFPVYKENERVDAIFVLAPSPISWEGKKEIYREDELKKLLGQTTIFPKIINPLISAKDAIEIAKKNYGEEIVNISEPLLLYSLSGPYYYIVSVTGKKGAYTYGISAYTYGNIKAGEVILSWPRIIDIPDYETCRQKAITFLNQEGIEGEIVDGYLIEYWIPGGMLVSNETTIKLPFSLPKT
jgi:hypothetical protein